MEPMIKTEIVTAENSQAFFERYNFLIRCGFNIASPEMFDRELFDSVRTNYWRAELTFAPQQYLDRGLDKLPFEDLKALAYGLNVGYGKSRDKLTKNIKDALAALGFELPVDNPLEPQVKKATMIENAEPGKAEQKENATLDPEYRAQPEEGILEGVNETETSESPAEGENKSDDVPDADQEF